MQSAVVFYGNAHRLIGLAIAEFRIAIERPAALGYGRRGNPVHAAHLAGNGIQGRFVAVGNVKDIVWQIFFHHKPSALFFLAFHAAEVQALALPQSVVHQPLVFAYFFPGKVENFTGLGGKIAA